jgi:hypothetical protein
MELTVEQRERIRMNYERALAIQKQRKIEQQQEEQQPGKEKVGNDDREIQSNRSDENRLQPQPQQQCDHHDDTDPHDRNIKRKMDDDDGHGKTKDKEMRMEDWEYTASLYVSKQEAKTIYCLPEGTISCCHVMKEIENPKNQLFSKVKLYLRSDIRQRAYQRYGGSIGLQQERNKRQQILHEKHIQDASNIFQNQPSPKSNNTNKKHKRKRK